MPPPHPEPDLSAALQQAILVGQQGVWPEAARQLQALAEAAPDNAVIWLWLGYALEQSGNCVGALSAYRSGLNTAPDDADLRQGAARMHARMAQARGVFAPPRPELVGMAGPAPAAGGGATRLVAGAVAAVVMVALLGVFAALSVPRLHAAKARGEAEASPSLNPHATQKAKEAELKAHLAELRSAIQAFHGQYGLYPSELQDLVGGRPPSHGYDGQGKLVQVDSASGPPRTPLPSGGVPADPMTGAADWSYGTFHEIGAVHSAAEGSDADGVPYTEY